MNRFQHAVALAAAATLARHLVGLLQLRRTLGWMASTTSPHVDRTSRPSPDGAVLHLVVPVLWEQDHVTPALRWFSQLLDDLPHVTLTIVTSTREDVERQQIADLIMASGRPPTGDRFPQLSATVLTQLQHVDTRNRTEVLRILDTTGSTRAVVEQMLTGNPHTTGQRPRLQHLHYPGAGRKAAQVNYAAAHLTIDPLDYVLIYDVDSRPDLHLLRATLQLVRTRTTAGARPQVLQQPSVFLPEPELHGAPSIAAAGAALLQSVWTLRRELPALRRHTRACRSGRRLGGGLAQTPGHGLAVRMDVFTHLGGLPEHARLDDLAFGFTVTAHRIPVDVVPAVTTASSPSRARDVVAQHRRWFTGYRDYPGQARHARRSGASAGTTAAALAVAGYRAGMWLAAGPATAVCTLALLHPRSAAPARMLAAAALTAGCVAPPLLLARHEPLASVLGLQRRPAALAAAAVRMWVAYLIRSLGPAAALIPAHSNGQATLSGRTARRAAGAVR